MAKVRINWRLKAILPLLMVLLAGVATFVEVTLTLEASDRGKVVLVATAGAIAICAVMLVMMATLVQRPLVELQDKISRLRSGDMEVAVSFADRRDEIGDLGRNFNDTVRQLRESREEIQRLHRTQISRAEHFSTMGELAAGLAHEIRNPLAGISGVMEVIRRDLPAQSPACAVLDEVKHEVQRVNRIVSDLVLCARPKPPEIRATDLNATAEHAMLFVRQQANSGKVALEFVPDKQMDAVEHDSSQIQQVILNLLLNAVQSINDAGGKVTMKVEQKGTCAAVSVKDTGKGMTAQQIEHVFRPFFTTKKSGTGLGLSLAKRIVDEHGGRIEVVSEVEKGTEFTVRLPMRRDAGKCHVS